MSVEVRIDAKGKYYTDKVTTQTLEVVAVTRTGTIRGMIHIHPGHRLSDELNSERLFIALTDATVPGPNGEELRVEFVAVNKSQLVWVVPVEAIGHPEEEAP
ncbi:MAG: hypothetical protein Q9O62_02155 [Ardenticatenia bacterium]|nr:hypothetical protein [Ardenticatenia bacterium]